MHCCPLFHIFHSEQSPELIIKTPKCRPKCSINIHLMQLCQTRVGTFKLFVMFSLRTQHIFSLLNNKKPSNKMEAVCNLTKSPRQVSQRDSTVWSHHVQLTQSQCPSVRSTGGSVLPDGVQQGHVSGCHLLDRDTEQAACEGPATTTRKLQKAFVFFLLFEIYNLPEQTLLKINS